MTWLLLITLLCGLAPAASLTVRPAPRHASRGACVSMGLSRKSPSQQAAEEQQNGLMTGKLDGGATAAGLFPDDGMSAGDATSLAKYRSKPTAASAPTTSDGKDGGEAGTELSPEERRAALLKKLAAEQ